MKVLLPARRRPRLRDLLDHRARVRDDGQQLRDARHDGLRPPGDLGGLARGLAAPLRQRRAGNAFRLDGRPISQWSRIAAGRSDDLGTSGASGNGHHCH